RRADQRRHLTPRAFDRLLRAPSERMLAARGVAELRGEVRQHRLEDTRVDGRRRVVVEIDGALAHGLALRGNASGTLSSSAGPAGDISCSEQVARASTMRSLSRQRGSRTLHFANCPQLSASVEHAVTVSG